MQVNYEGIKIDLVLMDIKEFRDKKDFELIREKGIYRIICISHHKNSLIYVLKLVSVLFKKWGGWLGNDNEGFIPIYGLDNISSFQYD